MNFFYLLLATLCYILALPFLIFLRFKAKYKNSIPSRFFLKNNPPFSENGVWFHACSFGEVRSLSPFIKQIDSSDIRISVITQTGFEEAKKHSNAQVRYLPFEIFLPFWIRKQSLLIVMEAELWPFLFIYAKSKGIKTVLLNARVSDNSYASYCRFAWVYRWIFRSIDVVFAQSEKDAQRLRYLGAKTVHISGNIKAYAKYSITHNYPKDESRRIIVIGSTHEGEEEMILSQISLRDNDRIIVVPRHPERFEKVGKFLQAFAHKNGKTYNKISLDENIKEDFILCDKMGELVNLYAIADVVILGGSFVEGVGGHNPLEPAYFGVKLISGEAIFNQKVLFEAVENSILCNIATLKDIFETIDNAPKSGIIYQGKLDLLLEQILGDRDGKSV